MEDWIKELRIKRQTNLSPLIIVETDDIGRYRNLIEAKPHIMTINGAENWFTLENWNGLKQIKPSYKEIDNSRDAGGGDITFLLAQASEMLFPEEEKEKKRDWLKTKSGKKWSPKPAVLVVKNILESNAQINYVLFSWATDEELRKNHSTVILFLEDRSIIPQSVWSHVKIISPPKSTAKERRDLIEQGIKDGAFNRPSDELMLSAIRQLAGLNTDEIDAVLAEMAIMTNNKFDLDTLANLKMEVISKDPAIDFYPPKHGFEVIGGLKQVQKRIQDEIIMPLKNPEYADAFSIGKPRGMILFGPPGTGKTILAKALQKELNMSMISMQPDKIFSKWVGESEKKMRNVFKDLDAMAPCIFFIDEFDRHGKRSTGGSSDDGGGAHVQRQIFSMLLEKLGDEERKWFFVATTNLIEALDPAMIRTGRIDSVIPVPFPDRDARIQILEIHATKRRKLPIADNVDWKKLAEETNYWAGSDLEELIIRTAKYKMKKSIEQNKKLKIHMNDFTEILETFNVNIKNNEKLQKRTEEQAKKFSNDKRMMEVFKESQTSEKFDPTIHSSRLSEVGK
jgi:ATP-dependent 26S proteasome regulatory subunit